jgi:hypothetical protein
VSSVAEAWIEAPGEPDVERVPSESALSPRPTVEALDGGGPEERSGERWNVLAEQLVAYPPAHRRIFLEPEAFESAGRPVEGRSEGSRSYGEAWLDAERRRLRERALNGLAAVPEAPMRLPAPPAGRESLYTSLQQEVDRASCSDPIVRRATGARAVAHRRVPTAGATAVEPRGSRRLLPGVATLAVLVGLWFGFGALAAVHRPAMKVLPGSVRVAGGYAYVARPGDTLWSIAEAVVSGGDPRPLVSRLETEIGGDTLRPGDRLLLP